MPWRGLALALALLPAAAAHGAPAPYDPLVVEIHGFVHPDSTIREGTPAAGAIAFPPSPPPGAASQLRFTFPAPLRFSPAGGSAVELALRADAPVATGDGLELAIEPGGTPQRVALAPLLAPGDAPTVRVTLPGAADYAEGTMLSLSIRLLGPGLTENALFVVVGPEATRVDVRDMRVPSIADLALQDTPLIEFLAEGETFSPARAATVHRFDVAHAGVGAPSTSGAGNATYVVLVGAEGEMDAAQHSFPDRARRIGSSHAFTINGVLARVHPGIGVVVPVAELPARIACVANCPPGGFAYTIGLEGAAAPEDRPSALVPPPRETRDIPVSKDEPAGKESPGLAPMAMVAAGLLLGLASRRPR